MEEAEYCNRLAMINRGKLVALGTPTELKHKFMTGELLLVECQPLGPAVEALQSAPEVLDAAVFGNALHLRRARGKVRHAKNSVVSARAETSRSATSSIFAPAWRMFSFR